jgi:peroxiredoxin
MRVVAILAGAVLLAGSMAIPASAGPLALGDKLTPFTLKDAAGKDVDLGSFKGKKALVLIFVSTECPVSNGYNERMAALGKDYSGRSVMVVGINANKQETPQAIGQHASKHGFTFPVLKDEGNVQADHFGASVTPEAYVFDSSSVLRYHGRIDDSRTGSDIKSQDLRNAIDAVLAGQEPPVKETKAFGCTIKRVSQ